MVAGGALRHRSVFWVRVPQVTAGEGSATGEKKFFIRSPTVVVNFGAALAGHRIHATKDTSGDTLERSAGLRGSAPCWRSRLYTISAPSMLNTSRPAA